MRTSPSQGCSPSPAALLDVWVLALTSPEGGFHQQCSRGGTGLPLPLPKQE